MTTWNPPVYNSTATLHQETMQWSGNNQVFKQETFKVEPTEQITEQFSQHSNDNFHGQQTGGHQNQDPEFQHLFSPLK